MRIGNDMGYESDISRHPSADNMAGLADNMPVGFLARRQMLSFQTAMLVM